MDNKYFAQKDGEELAQHLGDNFRSWREGMGTQGDESTLAKAYRYYYGQQTQKSYSFDGKSVHKAGDDGELSVYSTNHYRSIVRNILAMTTSHKPSFDARAINTDLETLQRAKLGSQIVDYYMHHKKIFIKSKRAAEMSLVLNQGFIVMDWDTTKGEPVRVKQIIPEGEEQGSDPTEVETLIRELEGESGEDGGLEKIVYEGDVAAKVHSPLDVRIDEGVENWEEVKWADIRDYENKWELVAQYPEMAEEIKGQSEQDSVDKTKHMGLRSLGDRTDMIEVYKFYHMPSPALPSGRFQKRLADGTVLYDGPYMYGDKFNVLRIAPGEVFGSTCGYSDLMDLLQLQDVYNTLASSAFTNQKAFAVQVVAVTEGSNITPEQTAGMTFIKIPSIEHMPRAVQLTSTPKEVFDNQGSVERNMEKVSGVNSVVRGDPEHNLKSGVALMRVQAMAIQYTSPFQEAWATLLQDVGSFILHLIKNYAKEEKVIALSGKHNRGMAKSFKGEDVHDVEDVMVDLGNPISRSIAGKTEIANMLLDKGVVTDVRSYLTVMETGNLDILTEGETSENHLIKRENEALMGGQGMDALTGDAHLAHMKEHKALLADPSVRLNSDRTSIVLSHIQHHIQLYQTQDPMFAQLNGEPPYQPPMPPPPPPQGPGGGQGPMPPPQGPPPQSPPPPQGLGPLPVEGGPGAELPQDMRG